MRAWGCLGRGGLLGRHRPPSITHSGTSRSPCPGRRTHHPTEASMSRGSIPSSILSFPRPPRGPWSATRPPRDRAVPGRRHAVHIGTDREESRPMPLALLMLLLHAVDPAPCPHERLHMRRRRVLGEAHQLFFVLRRRDPRERPRLRVGGSPSRITSLSRGRCSSARATLTFSPAAPMSIPVRQLSQWAQVRRPACHPSRASNSRISSRRR